ncbi:MAG TPA: GSCFA domain-containing protein [Candidatus Coprenecus pullistercoris]|nr:GSCFA domain-containing protein [Candidatus Coprenecus pullistercoris]
MIPEFRHKVTAVETINSPVRISTEDRVLSLGSCFADGMGRKMTDAGYCIYSNPFGVLYNPASIADALTRMADKKPFTPDDVIPRDTNPVRKDRPAREPSPLHRPIAPDGGGWVSFHHHGSFARKNPEEFLSAANASLEEAAAALEQAGWIIVTFGTAWVYRHTVRDIIVSNCHKHPAWEFRRELLGPETITSLWSPILERFPDKRFILTVSPIRHKKDGMHGNRISKATLLLSVETLVNTHTNASYFPSYEIMLDELRDYSWYAEDLVHPSDAAVDYIWQRFRSTML